MHIDNIMDLVKSRKWYHIFEIVPGVFSDGKVKVYPRETLDTYGVPADLNGKRALDIGAWDGPYSFELERRGAVVTALDIQDPDATGFSAVKRLRDSSVQYVRSNVYEMPDEWKERFDVVLFLGVYYHLKNPLLALQNIWKIMAPGGMIFFEGAVLDHAEKVDSSWQKHIDVLKNISPLPLCLFAREEYCKDRSNWSIPTQACLHEWLKATGFEIVKSGINEEASRGWGQAVKSSGGEPAEHDVISLGRWRKLDEIFFFWRRCARWINRKFVK